MTFSIALSGIAAASTDLAVISNNIANAGTLGFKESRVEFAELLTQGVAVASQSQLFSQGTIEFTGNELDIAISGDGFFSLNDNGTLLYARAGAFGVDQDGFVVNSVGQRLQVFPEAGSGVFDIGNLVDLRLTLGEAEPQATTSGEVGVNLTAGASPPILPVFDPLDGNTFNNSTSTTIFDSLGSPHTATFYFVRGTGVGDWTAHLTIDGQTVGTGQTLEFNSNGLLSTPITGELTYPAFPLTNGAEDLNVTWDFSETTQFGAEFSIARVAQDGFGVGLLTGLEVNDSGVVLARFTNGTTQALGQIAMSAFTSPQGLQVEGDNTWVATSESGEPLRGVAGTSQFGLIQSGSLEQSNVDLTQQLVDMIIAQRGFQANAQVISVQDEVQQTILNL
ncbi:MAG: flagellar hook protein FlgE [Pseudomonadota bacterium]